MAATCVSLGFWQLRRYGESAERSAAIVSAWQAPPVAFVPPELDEALRHRQARLEGHFTEDEPALVSGGAVGGEPGHQLIAVFQPDHGPPLLVDRGWVPTDLDLAALHALRPDGPVVVEGLLEVAEGRTDLAPVRGADGVLRWPLETDRAYGLFPRVLGPPFGAMVAASGGLAPYVLRVGPAFEPEHPRPVGSLPVPGYVLPLPRTHHLSYAAQWFAFAAMAVALWAWAALRPRKERSDG